MKKVLYTDFMRVIGVCLHVLLLALVVKLSIWLGGEWRSLSGRSNSGFLETVVCFVALSGAIVWGEIYLYKRIAYENKNRCRKS